MWRPLALNRGDPEVARRYFTFQARLKPGITLRAAAADVEIIARRLARDYPNNYPKQFSVNVVSWVDSLVGQFRKTLYTLLRRSDCCCSSRAAMSRTCCSPAGPPGRKRWRFASRLARDGSDSCSSC